MQRSRFPRRGLRPLARCWSWAGSLSLAACGGAATQTDGSEAGPSQLDTGAAQQPAGGTASAGPPRAPVAPITGPCPAPLGSPDELLSTPRADPNLELLALDLEPGRFTASQATYDRLVADLAAMRARAPSLARVHFIPPHDGRTLDIDLTEQALEALSAGAYTAWACLNDAYRAERSYLAPLTFQLRLAGIYDLPRVAELYRQLPGVAAVRPSHPPGGPPPLCAAREGDRYEYVMDRASAGCQTTCDEHQARHYISEAPGQVTPQEVWDSETGAPMPPWYAALCL